MTPIVRICFFVIGLGCWAALKYIPGGTFAQRAFIVIFGALMFVCTFAGLRKNEAPVERQRALKRIKSVAVQMQQIEARQNERRARQDHIKAQESKRREQAKQADIDRHDEFADRAIEKLLKGN